MVYFFINIIIILNCIFLIWVQNPIQFILFMVIIFLYYTGVLLTIDQEFLAFIIIIIYVGAISILFLFILMLLNIKFINFNENIYKYFHFSLFVSVLFFSILYIVIDLNLNQLQYNNELKGFIELMSKINTLLSFGNFIYTYLYLYLIVSGFVLFICIISCIELILVKQEMYKRFYLKLKKGIEFLMHNRLPENVLISGFIFDFDKLKKNSDYFFKYIMKHWHSVNKIKYRFNVEDDIFHAYYKYLKFLYKHNSFKIYINFKKKHHFWFNQSSVYIDIPGYRKTDFVSLSQINWDRPYIGDVREYSLIFFKNMLKSLNINDFNRIDTTFLNKDFMRIYLDLREEYQFIEDKLKLNVSTDDMYIDVMYKFLYDFVKCFHFKKKTGFIQLLEENGFSFKIKKDVISYLYLYIDNFYMYLKDLNDPELINIHQKKMDYLIDLLDVYLRYQYNYINERPGLYNLLRVKENLKDYFDGYRYMINDVCDPKNVYFLNAAHYIFSWTKKVCLGGEWHMRFDDVQILERMECVNHMKSLYFNKMLPLDLNIINHYVELLSVSMIKADIEILRMLLDLKKKDIFLNRESDCNIILENYNNLIPEVYRLEQKIEHFLGEIHDFKREIQKVIVNHPGNLWYIQEYFHIRRENCFKRFEPYMNMYQSGDYPVFAYICSKQTDYYNFREIMKFTKENHDFTLHLEIYQDCNMHYNKCTQLLNICNYLKSLFCQKQRDIMLEVFEQKTSLLLSNNEGVLNIIHRFQEYILLLNNTNKIIVLIFCFYIMSIFVVFIYYSLKWLWKIFFNK